MLPLLVREAIASVALEHAGDCVCVVCRADDGNREALVELLTALLERP